MEKSKNNHFSVMTFNIRNSRALEDQQDHNWNDRKEKVIKIIESNNPDIIGFQEVLHNQMCYLVDQLDYKYSYYGIGRDDGKHKGEYNPIFFNNKFDLFDKGTFWLSDTPTIPSKTWPGCCYRTCSWIKLRFDKEDLLIANTHLDEKYTDTRMKSIEVLSNLKNMKIKSLILMGDFNFEVNSIEYKNITEKLWIKDSFKEFNSPYDKNLVTYHGYTGERSSPSKRLIDFVFWNSISLKISSSFIIYDNPGPKKSTLSSDHWPLMTNFSLF